MLLQGSHWGSLCYCWSVFRNILKNELVSAVLIGTLDCLGGTQSFFLQSPCRSWLYSLSSQSTVWFQWRPHLQWSVNLGQMSAYGFQQGELLVAMVATHTLSDNLNNNHSNNNYKVSRFVFSVKNIFGPPVSGIRHWPSSGANSLNPINLHKLPPHSWSLVCNVLLIASEALCFWPVACLGEQTEPQTGNDIFNQLPDSFELQQKSPQGVLQIYSGGCWEKLSEIIQTRVAVTRTARVCVSCRPRARPGWHSHEAHCGLKTFTSFRFS